MNAAADLVSYLCAINDSNPDVPKVLIIDNLDFYTAQLQVSEGKI